MLLKIGIIAVIVIDQVAVRGRYIPRDRELEGKAGFGFELNNVLLLIELFFVFIIIIVTNVIIPRRERFTVSEKCCILVANAGFPSENLFVANRLVILNGYQANPVGDSSAIWTVFRIRAPSAIFGLNAVRASQVGWTGVLVQNIL